MSEFTRVASVGDISDPGRMLVEVDDRMIALFHVAGKFYAIDDVCTHTVGRWPKERWKGSRSLAPGTGRNSTSVMAESCLCRRLSQPSHMM
jgi:3-phenylpropionate/trans-cinnamate dioxygenase ferredoxin subunit